MGIRLGLAASLLATSGCAAQPVAHQPEAAPEPEPATYANTSPPQRRIAAAFVRTVLEYDARIEGRREFLARAAPLLTSSELDRLARSERGNLNWPALKARHERAHVRVTGVSRLPGRDDELAVTTTVTTRSDLGTVRQFVLLYLRVEPVDGQWLITDADGAGL